MIYDAKSGIVCRKRAMETILFLDIDGVLHPDPTDQSNTFCRREYLWQLLEARPELSVVISSEWRLRHPLPILVGHILAGHTKVLADRFIGVTPEIKDLKNTYRGRERECLAWLCEAGLQGAWLALDDVAGNFEFGSSRLVLTDYRTGLTADTVAVALSRLCT